VDAKIIIEGNTLLKVREMLTSALKAQVNKLVKDRCFFLETCVFNVFFKQYIQCSKSLRIYIFNTKFIYYFFFSCLTCTFKAQINMTLKVVR